MARKYDHEYKVQAVKLAKEIGGAKSAKELGIPEGTIHTWLKAVRAGKLDMGGRLSYSRQRNEPVRRDHYAAQTGEGAGQGNPSPTGRK